MAGTARHLAFAIAGLCLVADPALAYVGPGAGLSMLAAFWALLTAVLGALAFLILWPLRRLIRRALGGASAARKADHDAKQHGRQPAE